MPELTFPHFFAGQIRRERALDGLMDEGGKGGDSSEGDGGGNEHGRQSERDEEGEEEAKCKAAIEVEKKVYKGSFQVRWHKCSITTEEALYVAKR